METIENGKRNIEIIELRSGLANGWFPGGKIQLLVKKPFLLLKRFAKISQIFFLVVLLRPIS